MAKRRQVGSAANRARFASCGKTCKGKGRGFHACVKACMKYKRMGKYRAPNSVN